jgi:DNA (cytosine-5)-methyltransferase 1
MRARPKILDLYACAGGAGVGYARAGYDVVGADIRPSPRNPHVCLEADALRLPVSFLRMFDAIHASPPCQGLTDMNNDKSRHENLIPATRELLIASGKPYILENVRRARAHLLAPVSLFGTMFGLHCVTSAGVKFVLSRERLFETSWGLAAPADPGTAGHPIANVIGGHIRARSGQYRTGGGTGRTVDFPGEDRPALAAQLMGIDWMTMHEMSEAVPPAFTQYIGGQLIDHL